MDFSYLVVHWLVGKLNYIHENSLLLKCHPSARSISQNRKETNDITIEYFGLLFE